MPRDGSGIYTVPAGTDGVPDATISSAKYNGYIHDVEGDLNAARPIVAGGTGANSATAARANLGAEVAGAQVTNYNSHVFEAGSFWSFDSATGGPAAVGLAGTCAMIQNDPAQAVLNVREHVTGKLWFRSKVSGVWGAWVEGTTSLADADARYVNVTGDTMTGQLTVTATALTFGPGAAGAAQSYVYLDGGTGVNGTAFRFNRSGAAKWVIGDHTAIVGNGSDDFGFYSTAAGEAIILKHADRQVIIPAGTASSSPSTGALTVAGGAGIGGALNVGGMISNTVGAGSFNATLEGATSSQINFKRAGVNTFYVGTAAGTGGDPDFNFYNVNTTTFPLILPSGGGVKINGGASSSPSTGALVVTGGVGVGGNVCLGGAVRTTAQGNLFGSPAGNSSSPTTANTNIVLYDYGANNWAGVGVDTGGNMYLCTGSPTVVGRLIRGQSGDAQFSNSLTVGGQITAVNGVGIGNATVTGIYGDGSNIAIRGYAAGGIYFQSASGGVNMGMWDAAHLNVYNGAVSTSATTGALVVSGGIGVSDGSFFGSYINIRRNINDVCLLVENLYGSQSNDMLRLSSVNQSDSGSTQYIACNNVHGWRFIVRGNGNVENASNSYGAISDIRYKRHVEDAPSLLDRIMAVKVRSYHLEHDDDDAPPRVGVVSQEMEDLFPELVYEDNEGRKIFQYSNLWPRMLKAFQEHVAETRRRH